MSHMDIAQVLIAKVNVIKAIIFIGNPAEARSPTLIYPVENTMELGGVATGNMNAKEHPTAAAIIR